MLNESHLTYRHFVPAFSAYQCHNLGIAQQIQGFLRRPFKYLTLSINLFMRRALARILIWSSLLFGQDSLSNGVIDHISAGKQYTMLEFFVFSEVPAQILIPFIYWHLHSVLPNERLGLLLQLLSKVVQGLQDPSVSTSSSYYRYSFVIDARVSCLNSFLVSRRPMALSESITMFFSSN